MEKIVLDTSVVVKWFVEEKGSREALRFLEDYQEGKLEIIAPKIIGLELANALFFGAGYKDEVLKNALTAFYSLNLSFVPLSEFFIQGAREYMEKFKIAIYDALFIALAEARKIPLVSADRKHHQKRFSKRIAHLY